MKVSSKDRKGNNGRNWSEQVDLRSGQRWVDGKTTFEQSRYKPEYDDRPARTPKDRNTGSKLANKLKGKVIG